METRYVISKDGSKVAYNVIGEGPPLLLVHGGVGNYSKKLWVDTKWIDKLKTHFTIIAPDVRGSGETEKSEDSNFYMVENIINDFNAVLEDCNINEFYYFGWSYGATIGFHMCKNNKNIKKAICAGSCMGELFSKDFAPGARRSFEELNHRKINNTLDETDLSDEDKKWVRETNLDMRIAQFKAWESWPIVTPSEINTQLAIYTGTNDTKDVLDELCRQEKELTKHNIKLKVFDNLDHYGLINEIDTVLPWVIDFLHK